MQRFSKRSIVVPKIVRINKICKDIENFNKKCFSLLESTGSKNVTGVRSLIDYSLKKIYFFVYKKIFREKT